MDASVAVKWFLPEIHSEEAVRLLRDDYQLFAPDLIWAEFGNVLWKKWRRREIEADVARRILEDFRRFPLEVRSSDTLLASAWTIAHEGRAAAWPYRRPSSKEGSPWIRKL